VETSQILSFTVKGTAAPQGSKNGFVSKGRVVLVEASKNLKPWRDQVTYEAWISAKEQGWVMMGKDQDAHISVLFRFAKPKSVKRNKHTVRPDLDKLVRGILDGITQTNVIWADDSQVISIFIAKEYGAEAETLIEVAAGV
jgi:Holliday junction resolvase RusA-like endonuclease